MKTLNVGDGYEYMKHRMEIIKREGDIVMSYNGAYGYEVFRIRKYEERKIFDSTVAAGEYTPGTSEFGDQAYCFAPSGKKYAEMSFEGLVKSVG